MTGDFWRVLGILLLTSLLVGLVAGILQVPFTIAGTLFGLLGESVGTAVLSTVLITIGAHARRDDHLSLRGGRLGLLYADRRMRSEAFDLVLDGGDRTAAPGLGARLGRRALAPVQLRQAVTPIDRGTPRAGPRMSSSSPDTRRNHCWTRRTGASRSSSAISWTRPRAAARPAASSPPS